MGWFPASRRISTASPHRGLRFEHAHSSEAVCQPSRQMLMTARYPHHYGAKGFHSFKADTPTLPQALKRAGYRIGIFGKVGHYGKPELHGWDTQFDLDEMGMGRDPETYARRTAAFLKEAQDAGKPFFLVANSHDPHRPFAGADNEGPKYQDFRAKAPKVYAPEEIVVPGFLPDLPAIRQEVAQYVTSASRLDAAVGAVLKALDESGQAEKTLVMFASDHGMAFPFAKTNCYPAGTRSPWTIRWPGTVKPGSVDREHFVSSVDFAPTILEALGLAQLPGSDGRSFLPLLKGEKQDGRAGVLTQFDQTSGQNDYPMRAWQDAESLYIWNPWSDGKAAFKNESQAGLTMKAMNEGAGKDPVLAARVKLFVHRVKEEFYDLRSDPHCLKNLIDAPEAAERIKAGRAKLLAALAANGDPHAEAFPAISDFAGSHRTNGLRARGRFGESGFEVPQIVGERVGGAPVEEPAGLGDGDDGEEFVGADRNPGAFEERDAARPVPLQHGPGVPDRLHGLVLAQRRVGADEKDLVVEAFAFDAGEVGLGDVPRPEVARDEAQPHRLGRLVVEGHVAQPGGADAVVGRVGVRDAFREVLGQAVDRFGRDRMRLGQDRRAEAFPARPVNLGAGGVDDLADAVGQRGLEDVVGSGDVDLEELAARALADETVEERASVDDRVAARGGAGQRAGVTQVAHARLDMRGGLGRLEVEAHDAVAARGGGAEGAPQLPRGAGNEEFLHARASRASGFAGRSSHE
ncbi:MAG: sulfatase [Planctomycetota bacterium]|nr:sulfatase [Planctomycetota bacterium]